jgi:hypothetical protein
MSVILSESVYGLEYRTQHSTFSKYMRDKRIRVSEKELRIVKATRDSLYDEEIALGAVMARACRNILAEEDNGGVRL